MTYRQNMSDARRPWHFISKQSGMINIQEYGQLQLMRGLEVLVKQGGHNMLKNEVASL